MLVVDELLFTLLIPLQPDMVQTEDYDHHARHLSDVFNRQDEKAGEGWLFAECRANYYQDV